MIKKVTSYAVILPLAISNTIAGISTCSATTIKPDTVETSIQNERSGELINRSRILADDLENQVQECITQIEEVVQPVEEVVQPVEEVSVEEEQPVLINTVPNFNPFDLREPSNITRETAYNILEGSALQATSSAYVYAEEVYGVNSLFLMSLTTLESSHGRSELAIYNNNIGGIRGSNGDWAYFEDWGECIMYIAEFLSQHYLKEDGMYFNGYSLWGVNVKYCQDGSNWADMINQIAHELLSKL